MDLQKTTKSDEDHYSIWTGDALSDASTGADPAGESVFVSADYSKLLEDLCALLTSGEITSFAHGFGHVVLFHPQDSKVYRLCVEFAKPSETSKKGNSLEPGPTSYCKILDAMRSDCLKEGGLYRREVTVECTGFGYLCVETGATSFKGPGQAITEYTFMRERELLDYIGNLPNNWSLVSLLERFREVLNDNRNNPKGIVIQQMAMYDQLDMGVLQGTGFRSLWVWKNNKATDRATLSHCLGGVMTCIRGLVTYTRQTSAAAAEQQQQQKQQKAPTLVWLDIHAKNMVQKASEDGKKIDYRFIDIDMPFWTDDKGSTIFCQRSTHLYPLPAELQSPENLDSVVIMHYLLFLCNTFGGSALARGIRGALFEPLVAYNAKEVCKALEVMMKIDHYATIPGGLLPPSKALLHYDPAVRLVVAQNLKFSVVPLLSEFKPMSIYSCVYVYHVLQRLVGCSKCGSSKSVCTAPGGEQVVAGLTIFYYSVVTISAAQLYQRIMDAYLKQNPQASPVKSDGKPYTELYQSFTAWLRKYSKEKSVAEDLEKNGLFGSLISDREDHECEGEE